MTTLIPKFDLKDGGSTPTGAVNRPINKKLAETISVKDFGAVGDGVADDTTAIQNAIANAQAVTMNGNSGIYGDGVYTGTAPTVYFPSGVYKVTSFLTPDTTQAVNYLSFQGQSSIIVADAGVTIFGGIGFNVNFNNLIFREGATAISVKTNNIDSTKINIVNCEFAEQTSSCIKTDSSSYSTIFNIDKCKFSNYTSTGAILYAPSVDYINFTNNWVTASSSVEAFYVGSSLNMDNCLMVPNGALNTTGRWITNYGNVRCKNVRFGGENAGAPIVYNYNDLKASNTYPWIDGYLIFEDCSLSAGNTSRADCGIIISKSGLPSIIKINGCNYDVGGYIINDVDSSLSAWLLDYNTTSSTYPTLSINVTNNNFRGAPFSNSDNLTFALSLWTVYELEVQKNGNLLQLPNVVFGGNYAQTSSTTGVSIVDTKIYAGGINGFQQGAIYDVFISSDSDFTGSSLYRNVISMTVAVTVGYSGAIVYSISSQTNYNPAVPGLSALTATATFYDGGTEGATKAVAIPTTQIRIKVSGYPTGYEGSFQICKITKRV
jgi:hypothetical protein